MTFQDLNIIDPILKALKAEGYTNPTPIQEQSIPILLDGRDLLGCAQTGTGKTAAFAIPILQRLYLSKEGQKKKGNRRVKVLVVTPTRELAIQIGDSFSSYGRFTGLRNTVIFGGVKQGAQTQALRRGVDIIVATPGRLLDLMNQGYVDLRDVEYSILDEADHMLDMGFIHDIRKIVEKLPEKRQSLFFSATMSPEIVQLSGKILGNPEKVTIQPDQTTAERVEQAIYFVSKQEKADLLLHLLKTEKMPSVLVFSRTKHGADKIARKVRNAGFSSDAIHGNKAQNARQKTLNKFKDGKIKVLIATDIAARGIDVDDLSHVINYNMPNVSETYVHRIGRTGRANASGIAISFCDMEELSDLKGIQKLIKQKIPVISEHPYVLEGAEALAEAGKGSSSKKKKQNNNRSSNFRRGGGGGGGRNGSSNGGGGGGYWKKRRGTSSSSKPKRRQD